VVTPTTQPQPVQVPQSNVTGPKNKNAFMRQKDESLKDFRARMAAEMANLREGLAKQNPEQNKTPEKATAPQGPKPPIDRPIPANSKIRAAVTEQMKRRVRATPAVGISNRPGFGYDASVFDLGSNAKIKPTSLPPNFAALDRNASKQEEAAEKTNVQKARVADKAAEHLLGVSGLFIPGGQDREPDQSPEKTTRESYEQALMKEARRRGLPTLAVCGGSRSLARGFGAQEVLLGEEDRQIHQQNGMDTPAHPIELRPKTILGGAAPDATMGVSMVNSTHEKVVGHKKGDNPRKTVLSPVNQLQPGLSQPEPELIVSAIDPKGNPEGFETAYGAPIVGVTSHPESLFRKGSARDKFGHPDAIKFADNLFKGFAQSMQTYTGKQALNADIKTGRTKRLKDA
jgi:gamma-glutamyl-gamma-aminobutyrate hydrolase PuuD